MTMNLSAYKSTLTHKNVLKSIFVSLSMLICGNMDAQSVITFSSDQGLSNTCIRSIYEDSHHNIWITTRNGLNRFDGHKMNMYYHDDDNPYSVAINTTIECLDYDEENTLIGTGAGVQLYNYATDRFYTIPLITANGDTVKRSVTHLCRFSDGTINICVANQGSYRIISNTDDRKGPIEERGIKAVFTDTYSNDDDSPRQMLEDKNQRLWMMSSHHNLYVRENGKNRKIDGIDNAMYICEGSRGVYVATTDGRLLLTNAQEHSYTTLLTDLSIITSIHADKFGNVLICTDGEGLKIYNEMTGQVRLSGIKTPDYDFATSNVKDAIFDHEGNLWLGVYWKGLVVQPMRAAMFQYIGRRSAQRNTVGTNCITAISKADDGGLWVASDHSGLYHISSYGFDGEHWGPTTPGAPETITAIYNDHKGNLWLGSSIGGMTKFNVATKQFSSINNGIRNIYAIDTDKFGNMWIGTMGNGLYCYNPSTGETINFTSVFDSSPNKVPLINNTWINTVKVIDNILYMGTSDGMEAFSILGTGKLKKEYGGINQINVNTICSDSKDGIWVGTSQGITYIDTKNIKKLLQDGHLKPEATKLYTVKDGLPNDMVNAIEIVGSNHGEGYLLWISTDNGLTLFNPSDETFVSFFAEDGLQGNEFSRGVSLNANNMLYFGGINGVTLLDPASFYQTNDNAQSDTIRITDFYVNGKAVHSGDKSGRYTIFNGWVSEVENIDLCCDDNTFSIELSTMSMQARHIIYEYQINDGEWTSVGVNNSVITFNGMAPGIYDINIRARSYNHTSPERHLHIVIHQPWYNSLWAWLVYFMIVAVLGYIVWRQIREHRVAKRIFERHRQSQMLNDMRMQFFTNISHEIRTPMTLIMAPLERLKKMDSDEEHVRNYSLIGQNANRILQLINQLMDVRKIEKGQFHLNYTRVELVSFINNLYELFSETAGSNNIDFRFIHENIEKMYVCIDKSNFDKILMNLLSNAFKFTTDGGKITISLEDNLQETSIEPQFIIKVTDNGIGIPDDKKEHIFDRFYQVDGNSSNNSANPGGTGIGLNLASLITKLHEGTLTVDDNPEGKGTQFTLTMPQANYLIEEEEDDETEETKDITATGNTGNAEEATVSDDRKKSTILVIDDESAIREYICEELSQKLTKYTIEQFSNGKSAWEYLQGHSSQVALVISDIMMPEMDGNQLCRNLKQSFLTNHIPIILLTAKVTEQEKIEGLDIGADAYITKPFSTDLVITTVNNLINNRRRLRSKYENMMQEEQKIDRIELESPDEQLMKRVMKIINENLRNPELNVEFISREVGLSRVHFHRKLKELTNETPRDFIRGLRLRQAARLLAEKNLDISHVADACGFRSISTFSTTFKSVYGVSPKDYKGEEE